MAYDIEGNAGANLAALAGGVPLAVYAVMMPPIEEVWGSSAQDATAGMVHHMEVVAAIVSLTVAAAVSLMVKSAVPLGITLVVVASVTAAYEHTLRKAT